TKIVCTIGPATEDVDTIRRMIDAGMNVARINFSHGTHDEHLRQMEAVREASEKSGVPIAIMQDLCGPRIRVGEIKGSIELREGQIVTLGGEIPVTYPELYRDLKPGDRVMLADGEMVLEVVEVGEEEVKCRVVVGGELTSHKGINLPGVSLSVPSITEKDLEDLEFGLKNGVDWVAISFVRSAEDVRLIKRRIAEAGMDVPVIAKIEKHEALKELDRIIAEADGVMVARGDLGVELPLCDVPILQKEIIRKANDRGKPVITATQMLASMIERPRPTRAEVSDVANAIFDGTDAVMLSGETAIGKHPVEAVEVMAEVAVKAEEAIDYVGMMEARRMSAEPDVPDAIAHAACYIALDISAKAIICCTRSGATARLVSKYRPGIPIIAVTPDERVLRRLTLFWGVHPFLIEEISSTDRLIARAKEVALSSGFLSKGDRVVIVAGLPTDRPGTTNAIKADVI
ncbi:pyruvate kinase, partial [Candidatus Poribacteria bacterium]